MSEKISSKLFKFNTVEHQSEIVESAIANFWIILRAQDEIKEDDSKFGKLTDFKKEFNKFVLRKLGIKTDDLTKFEKDDDLKKLIIYPVFPFQVLSFVKEEVGIKDWEYYQFMEMEQKEYKTQKFEIKNDEKDVHTGFPVEWYDEVCKEISFKITKKNEYTIAEIDDLTRKMEFILAKVNGVRVKCTSKKCGWKKVVELDKSENQSKIDNELYVTVYHHNNGIRFKNTTKTQYPLCESVGGCLSPQANKAGCVFRVMVNRELLIMGKGVKGKVENWIKENQEEKNKKEEEKKEKEKKGKEESDKAFMELMKGEEKEKKKKNKKNKKDGNVNKKKGNKKKRNRKKK